jgi:hypothetical protein
MSYFFCENSGSFAMFAAMRRASSGVSKSSAAVRWGAGQIGAPPAALPITTLFFFESETAGLMFVRHRWNSSNKRIGKRRTLGWLSLP